MKWVDEERDDQLCLDLPHLHQMVEEIHHKRKRRGMQCRRGEQ